MEVKKMNVEKFLIEFEQGMLLVYSMVFKY